MLRVEQQHLLLAAGSSSLRVQPVGNGGRTHSQGALKVCAFWRHHGPSRLLPF